MVAIIDFGMEERKEGRKEGDCWAGVYGMRFSAAVFVDRHVGPSHRRYGRRVAGAGKRRGSGVVLRIGWSGRVGIQSAGPMAWFERRLAALLYEPRIAIWGKMRAGWVRQQETERMGWG